MWNEFKKGFGQTVGVLAAYFAAGGFILYIKDKLKDSQKNTEEQAETSE